MKVFVSYSAVTDNAPFVRRFVERLDAAIASALGDKSRHVFADSSLAVGDNWRLALQQRLDEAEVFVALYSPLLFNSPVSGQELGFFVGRLPQGGAETSAPIVPVWWVPTLKRDVNGFPEPPPTGRPSIDNLQHRSKDVVDFGDGVDTNLLALEGLEYLIHNESSPRFQALVDHAINRLATRVIELGQRHAGKLAACGLAFEQAVDVWKLPGAGPAAGSIQAAAGPGAGDAHTGSRVQFIVLAAKPEEISKASGAGESLCIAYRESGGTDWRPFWPDRRLVGNYLKSIALKMLPEGDPEVVATADFGTALDLAQRTEARNQPVFFVIDAWTARLPQGEEFVRKLNGQLLAGSGIVVPFAAHAEHPEVVTHVASLMASRANLKDEVLRPRFVRDERELASAINRLHRLIRQRHRSRPGPLSAPFEGGLKPTLSSVPEPAR